MLKISSKCKIVAVKRRFSKGLEPIEENITAIPFKAAKKFKCQQLHGKVEFVILQPELMGLFKCLDCVEISVNSVPNA